MLVRVQSVKKIDKDSLAVDCPVADFRSIEKVHRETMGNEPLRAAHARTRKVRCVASDCSQIRTEEHVRQTIGRLQR